LPLQKLQNPIFPALNNFLHETLMVVYKQAKVDTQLTGLKLCMALLANWAVMGWWENGL